VPLGPKATVVSESDDRLFVNTGTPDTSRVPLAAVVFLKEGEQASVAVRSDPARLADLWQVSFHLPTLADRSRSFAAIAGLADGVPIYDLARPLQWDQLEVSADLVESVAR
jgi:hypothetical protein